ncbi:MAG: hypothetical protein JJU40_00645, partial [Rhodobacteraceae bacterium]|nr:hypothetical protein [Paracoccaceae bacterium]
EPPEAAQAPKAGPAEPAPEAAPEAAAEPAEPGPVSPDTATEDPAPRDPAIAETLGTAEIPAFLRKVRPSERVLRSLDVAEKEKVTLLYQRLEALRDRMRQDVGPLR